MVISSLVARTGMVVGAFIGSMGLFTAGPALANSSASADIAAPLRAAQAARQSVPGAEDEQFSKLFQTWLSHEGFGSSVRSAGMPVSTSTVSIPSRMPVQNMLLSSGYGMRNHPVSGGRRSHRGIDLAGPTGTPIHATADGIVSRADWFSSYGLYVAIEHGGEIQTRYAHMSRLNVGQGQRVRKGDVIGFIGSTGRSTGPHLHYEVRINNQAVNPIPYMQSEQSVLASSAAEAASVGGPG